MISNDAFRVALGKCFDHSLPLRVAVALSGGVDSVCLTYLLSQYRLRYQPELEINAITIDHQYRRGSGDEAKAVGSLVRQWGVNHIISTLDYDRPISDITNFEEEARKKRYLKFHSICQNLNCSSLFVGHNLDDQLETFIHRLQHNSCLLGLVGLKYKSPIPVSTGYDEAKVQLYRPLLAFGKKELIQTCTENGVSWFEDATNKDYNLTNRNYIRYLMNEVVPKDEDLPISRHSLLKSFEQVSQFSELVLLRVGALYSSLVQNNSISKNTKNGSYRIQFPRQCIVEENTPVISRFLYELVYPISSVKHYHWSYARIERHLMPKILNFAEGNEPKLRLTYLNLQFDITRTADSFDFVISRQPILRSDDLSLAYKTEKDWGEWILFDNRFWIRLRSKTPSSVHIVPYIHTADCPRVHPSLIEKVSKDMNFVPAIAQNDQIISFPSYNLVADDTIDTQWAPKPSVYSL